MGLRFTICFKAERSAGQACGIDWNPERFSHSLLKIASSDDDELLRIDELLEGLANILRFQIRDSRLLLGVERESAT